MDNQTFPIPQQNNNIGDEQRGDKSDHVYTQQDPSKNNAESWSNLNNYNVSNKNFSVFKNKKNIIIGAVIGVLILGVTGGLFVLFQNKNNEVGKDIRIKIPETQNELVEAAIASLKLYGVDNAKNLKLIKKDKNLIQVQYDGGVAIIELNGLNNPVLSIGKDLKDYEKLYAGGSVPAEFLHGTVEQRIIEAIAREQKKTVKEISENYTVKVEAFDGEKSEFLFVNVSSKIGGGFAAFLKLNSKNGKYDWMGGGHAAMPEDLKRMRDNGFPEKYWKKALDQYEEDEKKEKEKQDEKKKKEEEEKKKKEEDKKQEGGVVDKKKMTADELMRHNIYKALGARFKIDPQKSKDTFEFKIDEINYTEGRIFATVKNKVSGETFGSHIYVHRDTEKYEVLTSGRHFVSEKDLLRMRELGFPERYWKEALDSMQKNKNTADDKKTGDKDK